MKKIIALALLATVATADIIPTEPVLIADNGVVVAYRNKIPHVFERTYTEAGQDKIERINNYTKAGQDKWEADGWIQAPCSRKYIVVEGDTVREMTPAEKATQAQQDFVAQPLEDRLFALMSSQPDDVKAQFAMVWAGVDVLLERGETSAARLLIDSEAVPPNLSDAKTALLAEFDR